MLCYRSNSVDDVSCVPAHATLRLYALRPPCPPAALTLLGVCTPLRRQSVLAFPNVVEALSERVEAVDEAYFMLVGMLEAGEDVCVPAVNVVVAACARVGDLGRVSQTMSNHGREGSGKTKQNGIGSFRVP